MVAGENIEKLVKQIKEFHPNHVYIKSLENAQILELDRRVKAETIDVVEKMSEFQKKKVSFFN